MNTKITQGKFFIAKIVVLAVVIVILAFLGFLGIMKLLEKNVLAAFTTKDLAAVVTISTTQDAKADFDVLARDYPALSDTVLGLLGSDTGSIWNALQSAEVKQVYFLMYAQNTALALAPKGGEESAALKTVLSKIATVQEKDGIWLVTTAPDFSHTSLAPTKEFPSIASMPTDTSVSNQAMITYRTYGAWDMGSVLAEAINTMPVSSASLVLHSVSKVLKDSSGSFLRLADGGYMLVTDSHTTSDLSTYFPQKNTFDTSLLAHLPADTKEFLGVFFDPATFASVKDFLNKEISSESSTIFANFLNSWIQDTLKTVAPDTFIAQLPRASVLLVKDSGNRVGGVLLNQDKAKVQSLYDQLYSAARFHYALEEVPVTLPDRTKGTYLRLNEDLLQKKTNTASGRVMETVEKEGTVLLTKEATDSYVSISTGTGSLLNAQQGNPLQSTVEKHFSPNLTGVAMKTMKDPIGLLISIADSGETTVVSDKQLFMGYKVFKNRVHFEFILK